MPRPILLKRINEIVLRWAPPGWSIIENSAFYTGLKGHASADKIITVPPLTGVEQIYTFLHEVGHVRLGHFEDREPIEVYIEEYEAEHFAHYAMRMEGLTVPKWVTRSAKLYVSKKIKERPASAPPVRAHIARWIAS